MSSTEDCLPVCVAHPGVHLAKCGSMHCQVLVLFMLRGCLSARHKGFPASTDCFARRIVVLCFVMLQLCRLLMPSGLVWTKWPRSRQLAKRQAVNNVSSSRSATFVEGGKTCLSVPPLQVNSVLCFLISADCVCMYVCVRVCGCVC